MFIIIGSKVRIYTKRRQYLQKCILNAGNTYKWGSKHILQLMICSLMPVKQVACPLQTYIYRSKVHSPEMKHGTERVQYPSTHLRNSTEEVRIPSATLRNTPEAIRDHPAILRNHSEAIQHHVFYPENIPEVVRDYIAILRKHTEVIQYHFAQMEDIFVLLQHYGSGEKNSAVSLQRHPQQCYHK